MRRITPCLLIGALLGASLARPMESADAARQSLAAFSTRVLPSLMPSMLLMLLLSTRVKSSALTLMLMAWLCGAPGGARLIAAQAPSASRAAYLYAVTGTLSPGFMLGAVGGLIGDVREARALLLCHIFSAALTGLFFRDRQRPTARAPSPMPFADAVRATADAMLSVAVLMTMGGVAARLLESIIPLPEGALLTLVAFTEVTNGVLRVAAFETPARLPLLCAVCSFGGLSILFQSSAYLSPLGVTLGAMLRIRLTHAVMAFALSGVAFHVMNAFP